MKISGVARIFIRGGQSKGAKRSNGGGGGCPPSHGSGMIFENLCLKMAFFTLNFIRSRIMRSGIDQFPIFHIKFPPFSVFVLLSDQQGGMVPLCPFSYSSDEDSILGAVDFVCQCLLLFQRVQVEWKIKFSLDDFMLCSEGKKCTTFVQLYNELVC